MAVLGSPPSQKQHPAPSSARESLSLTRCFQTLARSIPVGPRASLWILEHPCGSWSISVDLGTSLWSLEHPSGAQDAPGRDHPLPQSITLSKGKCFTLVPDAHLKMIPGSFQDHGRDPRAHGWAALRRSQHEIVPPVESGSST